MANHRKYFRLAAKAALSGDTKRRRQHRIGAIGVRLSDGVIVQSNNLPCRAPEKQAHAEARVCKKLDWGGTVYVVRVNRSGLLADARPCASCQRAMRLKGVKKVYYSIAGNEYGSMILSR